MSTGEQPGQGLPPGSHLRPPETAPGVENNDSLRQALIWGSLAMVILLGLAVLFVLPEMVPDVTDDILADKMVERNNPQSRAIPDDAGLQAVSRKQAAKALQDYLMAQARLELANAPVWGEPQWSRAVEGAARGNGFFRERQFSAATAEFEKSLELLVGLESEVDQRLANALTSAWEALEINDSDSALAFFETAIAIEADHEEANIGLERARVRPELLRLMDSGDLALSRNDLQKARSAYAEATRLDGLHMPAEIALQDVNTQIIDLQFNTEMSRALTAIQQEQVKDAELALQQADSLKPGQAVVADTRYQLQQLKRKLWLTSQRRASAGYEKQENWANAVSTYKKVLAREPQAGFARQGLLRAEDRLRLHQQFDHYLQDPERVYFAEPRANAEKLLASAATAPENEPLLAEKIQRLKALVVQAKTPILVTLQSDGQTNVSIFHVGRFGSFTFQQLELPPGTYTVVGSRPGYRDVRKTLTVKPGSSQASVVIQCKEPI